MTRTQAIVPLVCASALGVAKVAGVIAGRLETRDHKIALALAVAVGAVSLFVSCVVLFVIALAALHTYVQW